MRIDNQVERAAREAMAGSVAGEPDRFFDAIAAIADRGDSFANDAVKLAIAIGIATLRAIHEGERPDDEQLRDLSVQLADDAQDWAPEVTPESALIYLTALADTAIPALEEGDLAVHAFGTAGWLLSAFIPDEIKWTFFLDRILDVLEGSPNPSS